MIEQDADDGFSKYAAYLTVGTNAPKSLIQSALQEAYRAGIERAAKACDEDRDPWRYNEHCAALIRSLAK